MNGDHVARTQLKIVRGPIPSAKGIEVDHPTQDTVIALTKHDRTSSRAGLNAAGAGEGRQQPSVRGHRIGIRSPDRAEHVHFERRPLFDGDRDQRIGKINLERVDELLLKLGHRDPGRRHIAEIWQAQLAIRANADRARERFVLPDLNPKQVAGLETIRRDRNLRESGQVARTLYRTRRRTRRAERHAHHHDRSSKHARDLADLRAGVHAGLGLRDRRRHRPKPAKVPAGQEAEGQCDRQRSRRRLCDRSNGRISRVEDVSDESVDAPRRERRQSRIQDRRAEAGGGAPTLDGPADARQPRPDGAREPPKARVGQKNNRAVNGRERNVPDRAKGAIRAKGIGGSSHRRACGRASVRRYCPNGDRLLPGERGVGLPYSFGPIFWAVLCASAGSGSPAGEASATPPQGESALAASAPASVATATVTPLSLDALVTEALANNLQVKITEAQITEAKALLELARSQAYPQATLTALFGGPTPEAKTRVVNDINTVTDPSLEGDFDFGALGVSLRFNGQLVQPLYTFGKIDTGKKAANHLVRAARHQKTVAQAELVVNVNSAFWAFQLTQAFLDSLGEGKDTLARVLERIEELLEADSTQVTENDRLRLKYALSTLSVREAEAHQAAQTALRAMRLLLGWPQNRPLAVEKRDLDDLPDEIPNLQLGIMAARDQRPELLALNSVVDAAQAFVDFRQAGFYPTLFIGGFLDYAYTSNATNQTNPFIYDPFNFLTIAAGLGLRFELDIFTKLALLEQAEAQARVRNSQAALATQAVELEVHTKHIAITGGYQRIEALEKANRTARGWLTASALAYDIGTGRADELIDAFLAWAASEAELQTTRFNTLLNLVDFARTTGRLMQARSSR